MKKTYFEKPAELINFLSQNHLGGLWFGKMGGEEYKGDADLPVNFVCVAFNPQEKCSCCGRVFGGDPMKKIESIDGDFVEDWTNARIPKEARFLCVPDPTLNNNYGKELYWWIFD